MDFFGIGGWEILVILVVILIVAGPRKLPEIVRTIGKTVRAIRKVGSDFTKAVSQELDAADREKTSHPAEKENRSEEKPPGGQPPQP